MRKMSKLVIRGGKALLFIPVYLIVVIPVIMVAYLIILKYRILQLIEKIRKRWKRNRTQETIFRSLQ